MNDRNDITLLKNVLDEASLAVLVIDALTYEILYMNEAAFKYSKYVNRDFAGKCCYSFLRGANAPCEDCNLGKLHGEESIINETDADGVSIKHFSKLIDWGGRKAYVEYMEDITLQKQNNIIVRNEKDMLESILLNIPVGVLVLKYMNGHTTINNATPMIYDMIGIEQDIQIGVEAKDILQLVHPDDRERLKQMVQKLLRDGNSIKISFRNLNKKTGQYIWLMLYGNSAAQSDGSVNAYLSFTDISEQVALNEKLREREQGLRAAVRHTDLYYWELDIKTGKAYVGERLRSEFGFNDVTENFPESWIKIGMIHPDDVELYRKKTKEVFDGTPYVEWDCRCLDINNGCYSWKRTYCSILYNAKGEAIKAIATAQDIHDAKELEENFIRAESQNGIRTWVLDLRTHQMSKVGYGSETDLEQNDKILYNMPESIIEAGYFDEESIPVLRNAFERIYSGEKQVVARIHRLSYIKKEFRWYEIIFTTLDNGSSGAKRAVCTSRDITDERNIEQYYNREIENRKNLVSEMVCCSSVNLTKNIVEEIWVGENKMISEKLQSCTDFRERIGYLLENIELSDDENSELSPSALLKQFESGRRSNEKIYYAKPKGKNEFICVQTEVRIVTRPATGDIVAFFYNKDVTERIMSEMTAKFATANTYNLIGCINTMNRSFYIEDYNFRTEKAKKTYSDYETSVKKLIKKRIPPEDIKKVEDMHSISKIKKQLETTDVYSVSYRYINDNGEIRHMVTKFSYGDSAHRFIITARMDNTEILAETERKRAELQDALDRAQIANRAKSNFLSVISHDIRTPLNSIIGLASLTLGDADKPDIVRENIANICSVCDFLLGLVNDILDMAIIEQGGLILHKEPYLYADFLTNIKTMFQPKCHEKNIKFEFEETETPIAIMIDKVRINQAFNNILSNAVKFTSEGGQIKYNTANVKIENGKITADYIISDTGIGMSREFQEHMFEPFVKENNRAASNLQGTGLGLSISKQIIEMMGGSIKIDSELGRGTRVTIHMTNEIVTEDKYLAPVRKILIQNSLSGCNILLVEDNPINIEIAEKLLSKCGANVIRAENGLIALRKFNASDDGFFDVVLMDIRMPIMDGLAAARAIRLLAREDSFTVPIIAMSANAYDEDKRKAKVAGMTDYITKPFDLEDIIFRIGKYYRAKKTEGVVYE